MKVSELKHAELVGSMFAEREGTGNELAHYGVPGMKWGVRKEKESSGKRQSNRSRNANDYVSDKKRLSTGQKAVIILASAMALRTGYKGIAKATAKASKKGIKATQKFTNKYAAKYELKRLKGLAKIEKKYGPGAIKDIAQNNLRRFNVIDQRKIKSYGAKGKYSAEAAAKAAEKAASGKQAPKAAEAAKNVVKNVASGKAETKRMQSETVTKATKTGNKITDKAKYYRESRRKYRQQTKKLAKEAETKARNTIEKLEHDKKMEKLRKKRANRLKQTWAPYEDTISGMKKEAAYRSAGTSTRKVNKAQRANARAAKKNTRADNKANRKENIRKSWEEYEAQQRKEVADAKAMKQRRKNNKITKKANRRQKKWENAQSWIYNDPR